MFNSGKTDRIPLVPTVIFKRRSHVNLYPRISNSIFSDVPPPIRKWIVETRPDLFRRFDRELIRSWEGDLSFAIGKGP